MELTLVIISHTNLLFVNLKYREPVFGNGDKDFLLFVLPGLIIFDVILSTAGITGLMVASEYNQGIQRRFAAAGLSTMEIITCRLVTQTLLTLVQISVWNSVLYFVFGITCRGSYFTYYAFCVAGAICGASMGLLLGVILRSAADVLMTCLFFTVLVIVSSGIVIPLERMSTYWRAISNILPVTLPIISLRAVMVKGFGWISPSVWGGFSVLVAWPIIFILLAIIGARKHLR